MIRFGISEKAVKGSEDAEREASARLQNAEAAFSALLKNHATGGDIKEAKALDNLSECENVYRNAVQVATAMRAARNGQIENEIRRALCDHADELDGKQAHYKRTAKLVKEIVAERLEISPDDVDAYNNEYHYNFKVIVDDAAVEIYVNDNEFEADDIRRWCRPYDDGRDDLTPARVHNLVAQRAKEEKRLMESAEAHRKKAREAIKKFACIGDTKCLKDAATVKYV